MGRVAGTVAQGEVHRVLTTAGRGIEPVDKPALHGIAVTGDPGAVDD